MTTDPETGKIVTRIVVWGSTIVFLVLEMRNGFAITKAIVEVFTNG